MLRQSDVIKSVLAITAWKEAGHIGGNLASEMVAWAIANRVRKGWGNWTDVLSSLSNDSKLPSMWEPGFIKLLQNIDNIYDNVGPDLVNGGVYWAELNKLTDTEFLENVVRNPEHQRTASMGSLTFFN